MNHHPSTTTPSATWRRHSEPPALWLLLLAGSLVIHALAFLTFRPYTARVSTVADPTTAAIPIELVDVEPEASPPASEPVEEPAPPSPAPQAAETPSPVATPPPENAPSKNEPSVLPEAVDSVPPKRTQVATPAPTPTATPSPVPSPTPTPLASAPPFTPPSPVIPAQTPPPIAPPLPSATPEPTSDLGEQAPPLTSGDRLSEPPPPGTIPDTDRASSSPETPADEVEDEVGVDSEATPARFSANLLGVQPIPPEENPTDIPEQLAQPLTLSQAFVSDPGQCQLTPESARDLGQTVKLRVTIDETGRVLGENSQVANSDGTYSEAYGQLALCVVQNWEFKPATTQGSPVMSNAYIQIQLDPG